MRVECVRYFPEKGDQGDLSNDVDELTGLLALPAMRFDKRRTVEIKRAVKSTLLAAGWASNVRVPGSRLTVNFLRDNSALCVQLGNVARTYADLLKLQTLCSIGKITGGIIAVPVVTAAKLLGSNRAQFERLVSEIVLFRDTISLPLCVMGLGD